MTDFEVIGYIKKYFEYKDDGTFIRNDRKNSSGSYDKDGYLIIKIKGKQYKAHRLVFAYHHGRFPKDEIDHINRNRSDNRIENLRESDRKINNNNRVFVPNKDTGAVGIYMDRTKGLKKKFAFSHNGKTYRFLTVEEAERKRKELKYA